MQIIKRQIFSNGVGEQLVYTVHSDMYVRKEKPRFKSEAERETHRQEILRRTAEVVANPQERKIEAILAAKQNRVPIYATLPRRNGKRFIYQLNQGKGW